MEIQQIGVVVSEMDGEVQNRSPGPSIQDKVLAGRRILEVIRQQEKNPAEIGYTDYCDWHDTA